MHIWLYTLLHEILEEMLEMFATTVQAELNATLHVCESGLQDISIFLGLIPTESPCTLVWETSKFSLIDFGVWTVHCRRILLACLRTCKWLVMWTICRTSWQTLHMQWSKYSMVHRYKIWKMKVADGTGLQVVPDKTEWHGYSMCYRTEMRHLTWIIVGYLPYLLYFWLL
jgi:hypothetical protein